MKKAKPHVFWSPRHKAWIAMLVHEVDPCGEPNFGWFWSEGQNVGVALTRLGRRLSRCFSGENPQTRFGYQT